MFWSDPEESWAVRAWWQIKQTRELAMQKQCEYTAVLKFSPDGAVRMVETRIGKTKK